MPGKFHIFWEQMSQDYRQSIANHLLESIKKIVNLWEQRVRDSLPAANRQDRLALIDSLPAFLSDVAKAFASSNSQPNFTIAKEHGKDRANTPDYTLSQFLSEYRILRQVLFEILELDIGTLKPAARDSILDLFDKGIAVAGSEFVRNHTKGIQENLNIAHRNIAQTEIDLARSKAAFNHTQGELSQFQNHLSASQTAIDELEAGMKLRELFVATLTHDLRAPLTAIKMNAQLLPRKAEDRNAVVTLSEKIISTVNRADDLIGSLLDANRIQAGEKLNIDVSRCDLSLQLTRLVADWLVSYEGRIILRLPDEPVVGEWNCSKLGRAVENLVTNAFKYGDTKASVIVTLKESKEQVTITVHNEGKPIPIQDQPKIFDQYRRTKSAETGGMKGWGLGLTLVRGIVEAHRGTVALESTKDKGTTFILNIPRTVGSIALSN
jgi:signal transduction histidine kinase